MAVRRLAVLTSLLVMLFAEEPPTRKERVLAVVNGEPITSEQLDAATRRQVQAMEDQVRQLRESTLNKLIDNALLQQAARTEGLTIDEFLARRIESITVEESAVEQAYARSRDQLAGILPAEARYRIRRTLEDNARAAALHALLRTLHENGRVTNHFVRDAMQTLAAAAEEGPVLGSRDAPVTIIEFSDFECPYCRSAQPVLERIMKRWPSRVRRVFKHFPLERHPNAMPAAQAGICAERQGKFWALHMRMFASNDLGEPFLRAAAKDAGLDTREFDACMQSKEAIEQVRKDMLIGRLAGVNGTPTFFVNQQAVSSTAELESAIEKLLAGGDQ